MNTEKPLKPQKCVNRSGFHSQNIDFEGGEGDFALLPQTSLLVSFVAGIPKAQPLLFLDA
jgi:hypothetical protein